MLTIPFFEYAASFVVFGVAYILCATLAGYMQTWLLDKIGDSTARDTGYLTLNPLMHTTLFNLAICTFFGLPWYTSPPVNTYMFKGRSRYIKVLGSYSISIVVSAVLAFVFILSAALLTTSVEANLLTRLCLKRTYLLNNADWFQPLPFTAIIQGLAMYSKMRVIVVFLLSCLAAIALIMSAVSAVNGLFRMISYMRIERQGYYDETNDLLLFFGPLIVFYFFGGYVINTIFFTSMTVAVKLAGYLGLA